MAEKPHNPELEQLLSSYIDGQCSDADRRRIEAALRQDPALRALHRQLTQTIDSIRAIGSEPAPSQLQDRILTQLERRALLDQAPASQRPLGRWPWLGLAAAAMLTVAAGAGWWVYTSKSQEASPRMMAQVDTEQSKAREPVAPLPAEQPVATEAPPPADNLSSMRDLEAGRSIVRAQRSRTPVSPAEVPLPAAEAALTRGDHRARPQTADQAAVREPVYSRAISRQDDTTVPQPDRGVSDAEPSLERLEVEAAVAARAADAVRVADLSKPAAAPASQPAAVHKLAAAAETGTVEMASVPPVPSPAMELQVLVAEQDRLYVVGAVQRIVQQLAGRPVQVAIAPDRTTVLVQLPPDRQFLLADQVGATRGVAGVEMRQLAADLTSLEVASAVTHPHAWWPGGGLLSLARPASAPAMPVATFYGGLPREDQPRQDRPAAPAPSAGFVHGLAMAQPARGQAAPAAPFPAATPPDDRGGGRGPAVDRDHGTVLFLDDCRAQGPASTLPASSADAQQTPSSTQSATTAAQPSTQPAPNDIPVRIVIRAASANSQPRS